MNVVLLSDFSQAALHMQDYAAMLFQDQPINFTILHIKAPCKGESCSGKCGVIFSQKLNKEQKSLQAAIPKKSKVNTKFIEGAYIESIRSFIKEEKIDLIMLGNSKKSSVSHNLFFDRKTLEIITKVKCSVILIPEQAQLQLPKTALLPTDYSITLDQSIFNSLNSMDFINQIDLSLLSKKKESTIANTISSKDQIYSLVHSLDFKSVSESHPDNEFQCINGFDFILVVAKNLSIFKDLFSVSTDSNCYPEAPILFLHDSKLALA
ncbi:universal stress protein [Psychroflexus tropicus]|uniref:universal stress protein n=1 Tax=Psychroflexus tropicus TaxID=197345 RepID=UPI00036F9FC8|nr:universal stress protein [Psychroflexus tropicus]